MWANTYPTVLDPLDPLDPLVKCRIVYGAGKYDHTDPMFQGLKILNLRKSYMYSVQIFLYEYRQKNLPEIFIDVLLLPARSLHWRHNERDSVSNHQPRGCLLNRLFRRRSKKTSKLRVTGLYKGPVTRKMFPFDDVIMIHEHHTRQNNHYRTPLARCVQRSSALRCSGWK